MSISITPYIAKSGQSAYFFALSSGSLSDVTNVSSQPTVSVNGSPVASWGPVWQPHNAFNNPYLPYVCYQLSCGPVSSIVVQNGGSGYSTPRATVSGGGGSGCVLAASQVGGVITSVTVTSPGSGYTSPPTITITDTPGLLVPPATVRRPQGRPSRWTGREGGVQRWRPSAGSGPGSGSGATAVPIMGGVQPTDTVSFSAASSWLTAAAGAAPAASGTAVTNYAGQLEPGLGGYLPFYLPPNQRTLQVGFNQSWPVSTDNGNYAQYGNWMKRSYQPWDNVETSLPDGTPLTITGTADTSFSFPNGTNAVDSHTYPTPTGVWTFIADDKNPSNMMTVGLTNYFGNATVTPLGTGGLVSGGTLSGGVQVGRVWQWDVERTSTTNWDLGLSITIQTPGASGTYPVTLTNVQLFSPMSTTAALPGYPGRALAIDGAVANWCTTPTGRVAASLRYMDVCGDLSGGTQVIDTHDLQNLSSYTWGTRPLGSDGPTGNRTYNIVTIRTYAPSSSGWPGTGTWPAGPVTWSSPNVYLHAWHGTAKAIDSIFINAGGTGYTSPAVTATATTAGDVVPTFGIVTLSGGVITAIAIATGGSCQSPPIITITDPSGIGADTAAVAAFAVSDPGYLDYGKGGQWYVGECVTDVPHNLKTGQYMSIISGGTNYGVSNGIGSALIVNCDIYALNRVALFVTGPQTFAFTNYSNALGNGTGASLPGGMNNVAGSFAVTYTGQCRNPGIGVLPYEASAQVTGSLYACNHHVNLNAGITDLCSAEIARRIRDNLPPGRKVYVEYSNENWNFIASLIYSFATGNLGAFGTVVSSNYTTAYTLRAAQHHATWAQVFNEPDINGISNRGGEIVRCFGSQAGGPGITSGIVTVVNAYNAANPSTPIQVDVVLVDTYFDMKSDSWPNPNVQCTVVPTGGGSTGGSLAAGTYWASYTWIDALTNTETSPGSSQSNQTVPPVYTPFTVAAGNIPQVTLPSLPAWAASANLYLTPANGATGTEVLYETGITGTTVNLSGLAPGGRAPFPVNQLPSFFLAEASLASGHALSFGYLWPTPWARTGVLEYLRHYIKYNQNLNGPSSLYGQHRAALAAYVPVGAQPAGFVPTLGSYEGSIEYVVSDAIESGPDSGGHYLSAQITHDLLYDPEIYNCEMAWLQMAQQNGVAWVEIETLCLPQYGGTLIWGHTAWGGQPAGLGDGSGTSTPSCLGPAGTPVLNKFWIDTGSAQHLGNAAVLMQAARDWIDCSSPLFRTPLSWSRTTRPLTGPQYCSRYG